MTASSWTDLNPYQDKNDETRNSENSEDGDFLALKSIYDRQTHTYHNISTEL